MNFNCHLFNNLLFVHLEISLIFRFLSFCFFLAVNHKKGALYFHDSGGTPIPGKTMQTEYATRMAYSKQAILPLYFGVFLSPIRSKTANCLLQLYFSVLFSPFILLSGG